MVTCAVEKHVEWSTDHGPLTRLAGLATAQPARAGRMGFASVGPSVHLPGPHRLGRVHPFSNVPILPLWCGSRRVVNSNQIKILLQLIHRVMLFLLVTDGNDRKQIVNIIKQKKIFDQTQLTSMYFLFQVRIQYGTERENQLNMAMVRDGHINDVTNKKHVQIKRIFYSHFYSNH